MGTFLNSCLQELLLTEREQLYRGLSKVLSTCYTFAMNLHKFSSTGSTADGHADLDVAVHQGGVRRAQRVRQNYQAYLSILSQKHYAKMISKFKEIFETQLQGFLKQIRVESTARHEHFLSNMLTRLDYNDYYSTVLTVSPSPVGPPDGDARGAGR